MLNPALIVILLVVLPFVFGILASLISKRPLKPSDYQAAAVFTVSSFIVSFVFYFGTLYLFPPN